MSVARWLVALAGSAAVAASACASHPAPTMKEVVGPDGTRMLHVDCGGSEASCYQHIGQRCRTGYELFWTVSRTHGRYLVRCRAPVYAAPGYTPRQDGWGWAQEARPVDPWRPARAEDAGAADGAKYPSLDLGY